MCDEELWPIFERSTGRLYLTNGKIRRMVARFSNDGNIYVWWKGRPSREVALTWEDFEKYHSLMAE
jgi:hypothetical protein